MIMEEDENAPSSTTPVTINKVEKRDVSESAEEHVRRISTSEKSEEFQHQHSIHGDLTPQEILSYFGKAAKKQATGKNAKKAAETIVKGGSPIPGDVLSEEKAEHFTVQFLKALVPTPTLMGDLLSTDFAMPDTQAQDRKALVDGKLSLSQAAQATLSLPREMRGNLYQRRVSCTAKKCLLPECTVYHFRPADYCYVHSETLEKAHLEQDKSYKELLEKMKQQEIDAKSPKKQTSSLDVNHPTQEKETPKSLEREVVDQEQDKEKSEAKIDEQDPDRNLLDDDKPSEQQQAAELISTATTTTTQTPAPVKRFSFFRRTSTTDNNTNIKSNNNDNKTQKENNKDWFDLLQIQIAQRKAMIEHAETCSSFSSSNATSSANSTYSSSKDVLFQQKITDLFNDATRSLQTETRNPNIPSGLLQDRFALAQLYHQFLVLDLDGDHILSPADLLNHLKTIDIDWLTPFNACPEKVKTIAAQWLAASHPDKKERWEFGDYVYAVSSLRDMEQQLYTENTHSNEHHTDNKENNLLGSNVAELLKTAFWDLRMIVLLRPQHHLCVGPQTWQGHMLKRGYFFANEKLNAFRYRLFKVASTGLDLAYYKETTVVVKPETPPNSNINTKDNADQNEEKTEKEQNEEGRNTSEVVVEEEVSSSKPEKDETPTKTEVKYDFKGSFPLQEIAMIDFSPKTALPYNRTLPYPDRDTLAAQQYVVFKVSLFNGRRFTLAAKQAKTNKKTTSDKDTTSSAPPCSIHTSTEVMSNVEEEEEEEELSLVDWAAFFYWWSEVSRRVLQWRLQWGSGRSVTVTLRDWVNAGAVVAKVAMETDKRKKISTTGAVLQTAKYIYDQRVKANVSSTNTETDTDKMDNTSKTSPQKSKTTDEETEKDDESNESADKEEKKSFLSAKQTSQLINSVSQIAGVRDYVPRVSEKDVTQGEHLVQQMLGKNTQTNENEQVVVEGKEQEQENETVGDIKNETVDAKKTEKRKSSKKSKDKKKEKDEENDENEEDKYELTERELFYLQVVGIDPNELQEAEGVILLAVKSYYVSQYTLSHVDSQYMFSIGKTLYQTLYYSFNFYQYAAVVKNRIDANKYGVLWDASSSIRDCSICHFVFPSMFSVFTLNFSFLRSINRKHHCRVCGRVVCHLCSASKIKILHSPKLERVCKQCIANNGPPKDRILYNEHLAGGNTTGNEKNDLRGRLWRRHTQGVARTFVKKALGVDEDDEKDDSENEGNNEEEDSDVEQEADDEDEEEQKS